MSKTRVPGVAVPCFVFTLISALASRVNVLRELMAALLFFSLLFWGIAMSLFFCDFDRGELERNYLARGTRCTSWLRLAPPSRSTDSCRQCAQFMMTPECPSC